MIHAHSSTPSQRARWVSELITREGSYGVVSQMSRTYQVSRQTLYSWQAKGQRALEGALAPRKVQAEASRSLERAVLTLLMEGHASYRGIQRCLENLIGVRVSLRNDCRDCAAGEKIWTRYWPYWQNWLSRHLKACNVISKRCGVMCSWPCRT